MSNANRYESQMIGAHGPSGEVFRRVMVGSAKLEVASHLNDAWVQELWNWVKFERLDSEGESIARKAESTTSRVYLRRAGRINVECDGPPGIDRVFVKIYLRRKGHSLIRRLRPNRARREGAGLRAFAAANLPTPRLLLYGDQRTRGLFDKGVVVTARVEMESIASHYRATGDKEAIAQALRMLAKTHHAGLAHGDACVSNFVLVDSKLMMIDVPSWSRLSNASRLADLRKFLGTTLYLTSDERIVDRMMDVYNEAHGRLPRARAELMDQARTLAVTRGRA